MKISYRAYSITFIVLLACILSPAIIVGYRLDPLNGDLTRIGFYSENDYGWSGTEFSFDPAPSQVGELTENYDIVVLGDSFSQPNVGSANWVEFLAKETGLRVGVFSTSVYTLDELSSILIKKEHPPTVFLYETVERELKTRLAKQGPCPDPLRAKTLALPLDADPLSLRESANNRLTNKSFPDLAYIAKYIFADLTDHKFVGRVRRFDLTERDLFSNRQSSSILVYIDDIMKKSAWSDADWRSFRCGAILAQNRVHSESSMFFLLMIAPDKSSVYKNYIQGIDENITKQYLIDNDDGLNIHRVDDLLRNHVAAGAKDIYLPNNTHWSSEGHRLVAESVISYLKQAGLIN